MRHFTVKQLALTATLALCANVLFAQNGSAGVERYGLYIGSNDGGKGQQHLLYAGSDAVAFQKIMTEIGGISKSNGILLLDPTKEDVDSAFETISGMMERRKKDAKRSEFVFYYSGHSDENALLLGKTKYDYSKLKASITNVPSDVHVVILDSCYSGNFIRTKGGQKQKPFLMDDSSVVKGHAYLSSSSSQESSQESDEIGSSFFTNAMITGLRGAADTSGDKKVTLNELYSYAFNETLSKTENTADPQHPNYNITLVGSGDLVLSDVSASDCLLTLPRELTGRVILRDKNEKLVSEINKTMLAPVYLALEEGQYGVTVIGDASTLQGNFVLASKETYALSPANLSPMPRVATRLRGADGEELGDEADEPVPELEHFPFVFSLVCNEMHLALKKEISTGFSLGVIRSSVYQANGAMLASVGNEAMVMSGAQLSGVYNIARDVSGIQGAGVFNISRDTHGVQGAGVLNFAQDVTGVQGSGVLNIARSMQYVQGAGVCNVARDATGVQGAGVLNVTLDSMTGVQGAGILNVARGDMTGVQGAGIANFAGGNVTGVQGTSIANIALGNVRGVQVGFVNFCKGDCGFQLGLINYSRNGVFEVGASYSTDEKIRFTLNSGKKYLYTIVGANLRPDHIGKNTDSESITILLGLGTRFTVWKFNFDLEAISNEVLSVEKKEVNGKKDKIRTKWYPSARVSVGFTPIKHINLFAGFGMALETNGNEEAFVSHKKNMVIDAGKATIYPEFDFGVRFSVN